MSATDPHPTPRRYTVTRTRISRACVACQQKKQKCDGRSPSCNNCLRAGRDCITQDPSTKRQHPRGYLETLEQHNASLENHVAALEQKIIQLQSDAHPDLLNQATPPETAGSSHLSNSNNAAAFGDSNNNNDDALDEPVAGVFSENGASSTSQSNTREARDADDETNLEMLYLRSAGADPHYFGASSAYSFTKIFSASLRAIQTQAPGLSMSGVADSFVASHPTPSPVPLPGRPLTTMLTSAYFEQIHPQFPFLHRPTYMQWEEEVLEACEGSYEPEPTKAFFVYALSSIGALAGPLACGSLPEGLYASAENLFEHVVKLNNLESIQAILCCAMYSIRSPVGVSVWLLSGLALRQCTELGLHRNMRWRMFNSNFLKTQMRRRRPQGITDNDIDVEFPLDIDDDNLTEAGILCEPRRHGTVSSSTTMSAAIHTIRLRRIWAKIQGSIYPQVSGQSKEIPSGMVEGFKGELDEWLERSPAQLPSNGEHNNAFGSREWFEMMYHHSILLLHRYSLVGRLQRPSSATFLACAQSSALLCTGYRELYISNRLTDTWAGLHNLFLGGVTFIYCLWSSPETRTDFRLDNVSNICTACTVVLSITAERWASAVPYRDAFDMLTRATMAMLVETTAMSTEPSFPILTSSASDEFSRYFAHMAEVGICTSVEDLLATMLNS
ncbi:hypothetical protein FSARC_6593 [Fusarium sarcochroum]|uniref:Zn(2)-C6 fungal-type domain-containing protein n=1 Tax=Fusarium sarcochroum TaxID=1208366 RepID=A0A8H4X8U6_9HYPO|nr:hypothetical protein FSARC_6593 [Fusarium sarcochroum]